ncbi:saccharopine dehydrogenase-like oxidoreductase isoform X2 [Thrips palmi]|nr:saccharopine dehydrogenase-like oxidoreductase isoform X2 [Thrips palmi]XP_034235423.1 saccharopine dehydrogenase-like oxidoreductase isoform X2 [Thrips palmi]XP_034235424.1 saccharopine dehydrogenase-like oxidoreductase isoform X2 [Thrips palmi]
MANRLDFIIFGATGFTGQYTVEELIHLSEEKPATWGVAGRNKSKLDDLLKKIGTKLGKDLSSIEVIVADVDDAKALEAMAARAKVVINCCGPYRHWGEQVVKACIASGAHHVDVSGEPQYMDRMQLEHHDAALQKGVYIVSACGFDSIPDDLGLVFLQKQFKGDLNSVESYIDGEIEKPHTPSGALLHYGTYESAVYGIAHKHELGALRRKLFPTRLPQMMPPLKPRGLLFKSEVLNKWCMPFLGSDKSVMQRSQRFFYESEKKRPVQIQTYIGFPSLLTAIGALFFGAIFAVMCQFSCGRSLLLKYPKFFSAGCASHEGPSEETMKKTLFSVTLVGEGWEEHVAEATDAHDGPPSKRMKVIVKGRNPGYGATCTCLVLAAFAILKESDKMPAQGGVYPPGAAFAKTSLISDLNKHGVTFEVIA